MVDDLRNKWPFMKVEEIRDGKFLISDAETLFVFNPNDHKSFFTEELIEKRNRENMLNFELMRRYENLSFRGMEVFVKNTDIFTGYIMNHENEDISRELSLLNDEVRLIEEEPTKYTMCSYCQTVIPKDFVYDKIDKGCVCRYCFEVKGERVFN